ncbi:MAG: PadR family transcriptional regulator [Candidatus Bathyarchaeum sp.]|nr:MAG: PadR family transcriptional regulator [Candidatus Bathyarchaeum sp.]
MVNLRDSLVHGIEKPLILWLLSRRPRHGYELINEFRRLTGQKLKPGMIYPFLHWLEDEGYAVSEWVKKSGRNLRCYRLTEKGEQMFKKLRNFFGKPIKEIIADLLGEEEH